MIRPTRLVWSLHSPCLPTLCLSAPRLMLTDHCTTCLRCTTRSLSLPSKVNMRPSLVALGAKNDLVIIQPCLCCVPRVGREEAAKSVMGSWWHSHSRRTAQNLVPIPCNHPCGWASYADVYLLPSYENIARNIVQSMAGRATAGLHAGMHNCKRAGQQHSRMQRSCHAQVPESHAAPYLHRTCPVVGHAVVGRQPCGVPCMCTIIVQT